MADEESGGEDRRKPTQRFRRASNAVNLSADQRRRQASVMAKVWTALPSREEAMAFLNNPHEELGGRPLDLAVDSDEGLAAVEARLADAASARTR